MANFYLDENAMLAKIELLKIEKECVQNLFAIVWPPPNLKTVPTLDLYQQTICKLQSPPKYFSTAMYNHLDA